MQEGAVELSTGFKHRQIPLAIASCGVVLRLPETLNDQPYQTNATALSQTRVHFISRQTLLTTVQSDEGARSDVLSLLSSHLEQLYGHIRSNYFPKLRPKG